MLKAQCLLLSLMPCMAVFGDDGSATNLEQKIIYWTKASQTRNLHRRLLVTPLPDWKTARVTYTNTLGDRVLSMFEEKEFTSLSSLTNGEVVITKTEPQSDYLSWKDDKFQWRKGILMDIETERNDPLLNYGREPHVITEFGLWFLFESLNKRYSFGPELRQKVPGRDIYHDEGRGEYATTLWLKIRFEFR